MLEPQALVDIQEAIEYYDEQQVGLGKRFETALNKHFSLLESKPYFQNRYDDVHCFPIRKFPFMVHFTINETQKMVVIRAVFHTSISPSNWKSRK